jgi:hypothetical protein
MLLKSPMKNESKRKKGGKTPHAQARGKGRRAKPSALTSCKASRKFLPPFFSIVASFSFL